MVPTGDLAPLLRLHLSHWCNQHCILFGLEAKFSLIFAHFCLVVQKKGCQTLVCCLVKYQ